MSQYQNEYESFGDSIYQFIPSYFNYKNSLNSHRNHKQRPGSYNQLISNPSSTVFLTKDLRSSSSQAKLNGLAKLNEFRTKVGEVIDLCHKENTEVKG